MYVVVTKVNSETKNQSASTLPDNWPTEVKEFETLEAATAAYPGKKVYTLDEWKHFSSGLELAYKTYPVSTSPLVPIQKRWWEYLLFWRKP